MKLEDKEKLLQNKKAVEEINRHRWIESEKAGCDIGFENASTDWLERFSAAWMDYHMPKTPNSNGTSKAPKTKKVTSRKPTRSAKSYISSK